jgi:hypothetical protein
MDGWEMNHTCRHFQPTQFAPGLETTVLRERANILLVSISHFERKYRKSSSSSGYSINSSINSLSSRSFMHEPDDCFAEGLDCKKKNPTNIPKKDYSW